MDANVRKHLTRCPTMTAQALTARRRRLRRTPVTDTWTLHPDRALPADPVTRPLAREIYQAVRDLPIVSMHGHVDVAAFADDEPFPDPAQLLVVPDHYLTRMLVSQGAKLPELGVGPAGTPGLRRTRRGTSAGSAPACRHSAARPT